MNLANLGEAYYALGQLDLATPCLTEARRVRPDRRPDRRRRGHRILAEVHLDAGRLAAAREHADTAMALVHDSPEIRFRADALSTLARIHHRLGDYAAARDHYLRALALPHLAAGSYTAVAALVGLGAAYNCLGRPDEAHASIERALTAARGAGYAVLEANRRSPFSPGLTGASGAGSNAGAGRGAVAYPAQ